MYFSKRHQLNDYEAVMSLMESHYLGAWICHPSVGLIPNNASFYLDQTLGPHCTLMGHVARANDVWRQPFPYLPSVVMFQEAQSYITPNWYHARKHMGRSFPSGTTSSHVHMERHGRLLAKKPKDQ